MTQPGTLRRKALTIATAIAASILVGVVLWLDIRTNFWQDLVIIGGIVAGFVSFIFTVLVIDRVLARSTARRWAPVTRLALTELLHGIADEQLSEISRGHIVPRPLRFDGHADALASELHELRLTVVDERSKLAAALGTWTTFLASSSEHQDLLLHGAEAASKLDEIRDLSMRTEASPTAENVEAVRVLVRERNEQLVGLVDELQQRLAETV